MTFGLTPDSLESIRRVLARHPEVAEAVVFGSRALGRENSRSDVDIALAGNLQSLDAERIALELDELPLPVRFDVQTLNSIRHRELREHISRSGQLLYSRDAATAKPE
jgi:predicted nucleotidyltransferase